MNLYIYCHLISTSSSRPFNGRNNNPFNKPCRDNWLSTCKRIKLDLYLTPDIKIKSKRFEDVNVGAKTIKLCEITGVNLHELGFGNGFLSKVYAIQKYR